MLSHKYDEQEYLKFSRMTYCQAGHKNEKPHNFLRRQLIQRQKVHSIFPHSPAEALLIEVADIWRNVPAVWRTHIDYTTFTNMGELIKAAVNREDQLVLSNITDTQQLVKDAVQKELRATNSNQPQRHYDAHMVDIPEENDSDNHDKAKDVLISKPYKTPDSFEYP